ncbi:HNH endonuclease signature motif containing protein [Lentilactobacillus otakiensis]|uniref:HNH endonuclease signature motif containing protein n=1 Tax=Lentilactobacillus otakiensis TaxID=481720 RepID=UPI003D80F919
MDGHPWCEECLRNGRRKLSTSVDHVKPLKLCDEDEQLNFDNLQSLCPKCHNYKTRQEQKSYINK